MEGEYGQGSVLGGAKVRSTAESLNNQIVAKASRRSRHPQSDSFKHLKSGSLLAWGHADWAQRGSHAVKAGQGFEECCPAMLNTS